MKNSNRILAAFLSILMSITILPSNVFAEESSDKKTDENTSIDTELPSAWPTFRGDDTNNGVINFKTPKNADETTLYWAVKAGSGYESNAVGSPIIVDDTLVFCSGTTLYKMNRFTGEILDQKGEMVTTSNFNIIPPLYADGMIFVGLKDGTIQAFNAKTLESLWVYKDVLKGQPNTPLAYKDGYVYTGFWNSETKDANFVCVSATDEDKSNTQEPKLPTWTYKQMGGFYWAGAYVSDNFLLVGTDDGKNGYLSDTSSLLSIDPKTGKLIDKIDNLNGDIRSSVAYDKETDKYYFSSKGGSFYGVSVTKDGKLQELKEIILTNGSETETKPAMCTSTPVVHNGRAYVGVSGTASFTQYSGHNITVIDLESWKIAYTAATKGYPQVSGLLTTAYESDDGYAYIYFIDNYTPGEVRVIKDKPGITSVVDGVTCTYTNRGVTYKYENCAPVLFTPSGAQSQYAISSPIADENGTLYFKNDSAYIMALGSKIKNIEITNKPEKTIYTEGESFNAEGMKVTAHLTNGIDLDVTEYVSFHNTSLTKYSSDVTIYYNYVLYGDKFDPVNGNQSGIAVDPLEAYVDIAVLSKAESEELLNVIKLIADISKVTIESENSITAARTAFDALSDDLKSLVSNYNKLVNAEAVFAGLMGDVKVIEKKISDIGSVTYESKAVIEAARTGYETLEDDLKSAVSNYDILVSAEKALEVIKTDIKNVEEKISAIGEVTLKNEETVKIAVNAYNALPEQSQNAVKNASTLKKAEQTLKELKDGIANVISLIDLIGEVSVDAETRITAARTAYDKLNNEQKEYISNYDLLVSAEEKMAELKAQKPDNSSSSSVPDSKDNIPASNTNTPASNNSVSSTSEDASPNTSVFSENSLMIVISLLALGIIVLIQISGKQKKEQK